MADALEDWLRPTPAGLWCEPGGFHIDPRRAVDRALVTHGHADHARPGHGAVLATPETLAIMALRYPRDRPARQPLRYGETVQAGGVAIRLAPAGHVLGSAQAVLDYRGRRVTVSGDYKRAPDPTCAAFEPVPADIFISEATFGLPVFRLPDDMGETRRLLQSVETFPDRCHVVGAYGLGKCQRMLSLLRRAGYDRPVYLHTALEEMTGLYRHFGVQLGETRPLAGAQGLAGEIVLRPPGAGEQGARLADPVLAFASGWMLVRAHARRRGVELPLAISDHADWDGITRTVAETGAPEIRVTHGPPDALIRWAQGRGLDARPLEPPGGHRG